MENHLHFHMVHTLILLNLNIINSKGEGVHFIIIYITKKIKLK